MQDHHIAPSRRSRGSPILVRARRTYVLHVLHTTYKQNFEQRVYLLGERETLAANALGAMSTFDLGSYRDMYAFLLAVGVTCPVASSSRGYIYSRRISFKNCDYTTLGGHGVRTGKATLGGVGAGEQREVRRGMGSWGGSQFTYCQQLKALTRILPVVCCAAASLSCILSVVIYFEYMHTSIDLLTHTFLSLIHI